MSASVAVRTANIDVLHSFEHAVLTVAGPTTLEVSGTETGLDEQIVTFLRVVSGVKSASPVILQTAVRMHGSQTGQAVQVLGLDLRTSQVEHMVSASRLNLPVLSWFGLLVGMFLIYNTMDFWVAQSIP